MIIDPHRVAVDVDFPFDLELSEAEAAVLEANLHNAAELVLAPYFRARDRTVSTKTQCPGCRATSSSVTAAVERGRPCPECGLPADAILAVEAVRSSRATDGAKGIAGDALIRAGNAEAENRLLKWRLQQVTEALASEPEAWWQP